MSDKIETLGLVNLYTTFPDHSHRLIAGFYSTKSILDCQKCMWFNFPIMFLIREFLSDSEYKYRDLLSVVNRICDSMGKRKFNPDFQLYEASSRGNLDLINFYLRKHSPVKDSILWGLLLWYSSFSKNPVSILNIIDLAISNKADLTVTTVYSSSKKVIDKCKKLGIPYIRSDPS